MNYNEKNLRKEVKKIVAEYKRAMLGRYSMVDISGKKWFIDYNILFWNDKFNDWDFYSVCSAQKHIYVDLKDAFKIYPTDKLAVSICLNCNNKVNREIILKLDGSKYSKVEDI